MVYVILPGHTKPSTEYGIGLDAGSIQGSAANLCSRRVTETGLVRCLIFRVHWRNGSSNSEQILWTLYIRVC